MPTDIILYFISARLSIYLCVRLHKPYARCSFRYRHGFRSVFQDHVQSRRSVRLLDLRICMLAVDRPYRRL